MTLARTDESQETGAGPPAAVARFEAMTARLSALSEFVWRFTPALNDRREAGMENIDDDTPVEFIAARGKALLACFRAICRIAEQDLEPEEERGDG